MTVHRFSQFLQIGANALFSAGVLLGASLLVQLYGARLDLDIVAANEDELGNDEAGA